MKLMLLFFITISLVGTDLSAYRKMLDQSLEDEDAADRFYAQFKSVKEDREPVMVGFRAMSEFMLCKHLLNPFSKLNHFNRGRKLLETAVKRDKLDPELLFFRLSTQSNIPPMLRYNININDDKLLLLKYVKGGLSAAADQALYNRIKAYLLINQYCSPEEKAMIKNL